MYPGGTWMGGIDPFGDIMGTSAGPARGRRRVTYLMLILIYICQSACRGETQTQMGKVTQTWHIPKHVFC